ncbi:flagellar protein FlaG [Robertmurraya massiliosenegalensis]|uniref:flagellar protein FlaG n=1 Tax=Robertmurraya massiliosenegalensis TaxID=1287657 RepID=UPI00030457C1|nr:flagellar protein FlaG [Robertmurraya massiliosenegalensis]
MKISSSSHGHVVFSDTKAEQHNKSVQSSRTVTELSSILIQQRKQSDITEEERTSFDTKQLKHVVDSLNEFIEVQHRNSKFVLHENLDQYYVQVVDANTDKIIREIPPKKLLDAFYSMQEFLGMVVDEKI